MRAMQATRAGRIARLALLALATSSVCPSAFAGNADAWQFNVVPYLWLPVVHGSADVTIRDLRGGDGQPLGQVDVSAEIDPGDYLSNLHFALMFIAEARKGPWSIYTDLMYAQLDNQDTRLKSITGPRGDLSTEISRKAEVDVSSTIWTLGGGYNLIDRPDLLLDLVAGFRYMTMDSDLTLSLDGARRRLQPLPRGVPRPGRLGRHPGREGPDPVSGHPLVRSLLPRCRHRLVQLDLAGPVGGRLSLRLGRGHPRREVALLRLR